MGSTFLLYALSHGPIAETWQKVLSKVHHVFKKMLPRDWLRFIVYAGSS